MKKSSQPRGLQQLANGQQLSAPLGAATQIDLRLAHARVRPNTLRSAFELAGPLSRTRYSVTQLTGEWTCASANRSSSAGSASKCSPWSTRSGRPRSTNRIEDGHAAVFYAPDLVSIDEEQAALAGLDLYIGDGAAIGRSIIRRRDGRPIGHASISMQLDWRAAAGVPWAIFTHCGSEIVTGDARKAGRRVAALGAERGLLAEIARDGVELDL